MGTEYKDLVFHPRVITRIREYLASVTCLDTGMDPAYVDWSNTTGTEDGSEPSPFNTFGEGVRAVIPRGSVKIHPGSYPEPMIIREGMVLEPDGTPEAPVVIGE